MSDEGRSKFEILKSLRLMLWFLLLCITAFLIFLSVVVAFFRWKEENEKIFQGSTTTYQYSLVRYDQRTEISTVGIVDSVNKIDSGDFVFFDTPDGKSLISNFGEERYMCRGSCFCGESSGRRSGIALSRSLVYLLVASSSYFAYEQASSYFSGECVKIFGSNCPSGQMVISQVEECESITNTKEERDVSNEERIRMESTPRKYMCEGSCVKRDIEFLLKEEGFRSDYLPPFIGTLENLEKMIEDEKCEENKMSSQAVFTPRLIKGFTHGIRKRVKDEEEVYLEYAKMSFAIAHLKGFCKNFGTVLEEEDEMMDGVDAYQSGPLKFTFPHCTELMERVDTPSDEISGVLDVPVRELNPSIHCVKLLGDEKKGEDNGFEW